MPEQKPPVLPQHRVSNTALKLYIEDARQFVVMTNVYNGNERLLASIARSNLVIAEMLIRLYDLQCPENTP